jgi:hypothetical protein
MFLVGRLNVVLIQKDVYRGSFKRCINLKRMFFVSRLNVVLIQNSKNVFRKFLN